MEQLQYVQRYRNIFFVKNVTTFDELIYTWLLICIIRLFERKEIFAIISDNLEKLENFHAISNRCKTFIVDKYHDFSTRKLAIFKRYS